MNASERSKRYKNANSTIEKLRKERWQENQNLRKKRREEELNKLRKFKDNVNSEVIESSIFDSDVIQNLCGYDEQLALNSLKVYKNFLGANQSTAAVQDLMALGVVTIVCEIVCRPNIGIELMRESLSILVYLSVLDEDTIEQWLNENMLKHFHNLFLNYSLFKEVLNNVLLIINGALRVSETAYLLYTRLGFVDTILNLYQEIPFTKESFELRKSLLMFFGFFYQYPIKGKDVPKAFIQITYYTFEAALCWLNSLRISFFQSDITLDENDFFNYGKFNNGENGEELEYRTRVIAEAKNFGNELMEICEEMLFVLLCLTDDSSDHADLLISSNFLPLLSALITVPFCKNSYPSIFRRKSIIRVLRNIISLFANIANYGKEFTQSLHEARIDQKLWQTLSLSLTMTKDHTLGGNLSLLEINPGDLDKDGSEWRANISSIRHAIDSILKRDTENYDTLLSRGHVPCLIQLLDSGPFPMRREAVLAIHIILQNGSRDVASYIIQCGVILQLCDMLTVMDVESVLCSMECLSIILGHGESEQKLSGLPSNPYKQSVEQWGLVDKLEFLTKSLNSWVFNMANYLLRTYFRDGNVDSDEHEALDEVKGCFIPSIYSTSTSSVLSPLINEVVDSVSAKNSMLSTASPNVFYFGEAQ